MIQSQSFDSVKVPVMAIYNELSAEAAAETLTVCEKSLYDALKKTAYICECDCH